MKSIFQLATILAVASTPAAAGNFTSLTPTIAFVTVNGRTPVLEVANENGSAAATIYRFTSGTHYDVTSASQHLALVADQQRIYLVNWVWNGATMSTATYPIYTGPARAYTPAFSQDGSKFAFYTDDGLMHVRDTLTRSEITAFPTDFSQETAWRPDGHSLVVLSILPNYHLVEYPASGGAGTTLLSEPSIDSFDTSRIPGDMKLLVSFSRPGDQVIHIGVWNGSGYQLTGAYGGAVNWRCDQTKFAYRGMDESLYTYAFPSGPQQLLLKGNSGREPRYLKCDGATLMTNASRHGIRVHRF
jgi:hypothetical protein